MKTARRSILLLIIASVGILHGSENQSIDAASELQDAAMNYETAAQAQIAVANGLLEARQPERQDESQANQNRNRSRNAALQVQASDQFMAAAGNLDHATRAWNAAARATREQAAQSFFQQAARTTNQRAITLVRRAAELAEHAALEYAELQDLRGQSNASHKAGRIREQLAGRR